MRVILAHAGRQAGLWQPSSALPSFRTTPRQRGRNGARLPISCVPKVPKLAALMNEAQADVLAFMISPKEHRPKIHSINALERLNDEIKKAHRVVGIFPTKKCHLAPDRRLTARTERRMGRSAPQIHEPRNNRALERWSDRQAGSCGALTGRSNPPVITTPAPLLHRLSGHDPGCAKNYNIKQRRRSERAFIAQARERMLVLRRPGAIGRKRRAGLHP
jgi:hypothetical protein